MPVVGLQPLDGCSSARPITDPDALAHGQLPANNGPPSDCGSKVQVQAGRNYGLGQREFPTVRR